MIPPHPADAPKFVSRGGLKLHHAIQSFGFRAAGLSCADFGCSTGGFTDCLLQSGAARVYSIDTGYGVLAWTLRKDPRVVVMERANCLHLEPPREVVEARGVDVITIDASWTPQKLVIPAALRWLKHSPDARIFTLIKPHYEDKPLAASHRGILPDDLGLRVTHEVLQRMPALGVRVLAWEACPIRGLVGKSETKGNQEYVAVLQRLEVGGSVGVDDIADVGVVDSIQPPPSTRVGPSSGDAESPA
jgi:23S rRNA (cytidine1920-2'-O)/16S rRNA (cytidine1409-2'-O)-methyltransferase